MLEMQVFAPDLTEPIDLNPLQKPRKREQAEYDGVFEGIAQRLEADYPEVADYIESYWPDQQEETILNVDSRELTKAGIDTLFLDVEGTLTHYDGWLIPKEVQDWVTEARQNGIKNIVLITNKKIKTSADGRPDTTDLVQVQGWATQIGANLVLTDACKPSTESLQKAAQELDLHESQVAFIGDTSDDMLAANLFGAHSVYLQNPYIFGDYDHPGRRYAGRIRDYLLYSYLATRALRGGRQYRTADEAEEMLNRLALAGREDAPLETAPPAETAYNRTPKNGEDTTFTDYVKNQAQIVGFGRPEIHLTQVNQLRTPPPLSAPLNEKMDGIVDALIPDVAVKIAADITQRYDEIATKHGRTIADLITLSGIPLAEFIAKKIRNDQRGLAAAGQMLNLIRDFLDGHVIRHDPEDETPLRNKIGKQLDRWVDKYVAFRAGKAMVEMAWKGSINQNLHVVREVARIPQVWIGEILGMDTRSDTLSKHKLFHESAANLVNTFAGSKHPLIAGAAQTEVSVIMWTSLFNSWQVWRHRKASAMKAEIVKYRLTEDTEYFQSPETTIDVLEKEYEDFMAQSDWELFVEGVRLLPQHKAARWLLQHA